MDTAERVIYWTDIGDGKLRFYNLKTEQSGVVIDSEVTDFHAGILHVSHN